MPEPAGPHVEVAAYVLGKLEADEAGSFDAHLAECADCRRQLDEFQGLPELLAKAAPATPVPEGLRARTLAAVRQAAARAGQAEEAQAPTPIRRAWWRRRWLAVAVAAALVLALAIPGGLLLWGGDRGEVTRLTLAPAEGGRGRGQVTITRTAAGRSFHVRIEGLPPPPAGSLYELWAVSPQDTVERPQRVSLGTFTVAADGSADLRAFTAAPADRFPLVGVTLEPVDGNPSRTGPRVLVPVPRS